MNSSLIFAFVLVFYLTGFIRGYGEVCCDIPGRKSCVSDACGNGDKAKSTRLSMNKICSSGTYKEYCDGGCFPSDATVELEDGSRKQMHQLVVHDRVRVSAISFSDVIIFSHSVLDAELHFVKLDTKEGQSLTLTKSHYLYVNGKMAAAGTVGAGDTLITANGTQAKVFRVSEIRSYGLYNPHTEDGNIVVNDILTSTYTTDVDPNVAHALLFPVRFLHKSGVSFGSTGSKMLQQFGEVMMNYLPGGLNRYN